MHLGAISDCGREAFSLCFSFSAWLSGRDPATGVLDTLERRVGRGQLMIQVPVISFIIAISYNQLSPLKARPSLGDVGSGCHRRLPPTAAGVERLQG